MLITFVVLIFKAAEITKFYTMQKFPIIHVWYMFILILRKLIIIAIFEAHNYMREALNFLWITCMLYCN